MHHSRAEVLERRHACDRTVCFSSVDAAHDHEPLNIAGKQDLCPLPHMTNCPAHEGALAAMRHWRANSHGLTERAYRCMSLTRLPSSTLLMSLACAAGCTLYRAVSDPERTMAVAQCAAAHACQQGGRSRSMTQQLGIRLWMHMLE